MVVATMASSRGRPVVSVRAGLDMTSATWPYGSTTEASSIELPSSWVMAAESGFVLCRETVGGGPLRGEAPVAGGARAELTRGDAGGREGFE